MIKNRINFNNKKRVVVVTAAAAATIMLVVCIATIGAAPFSYQQGASERTGPRITSANIVDGEVRNQDLAPDAVTSDKIKDGEVKEEDLDPNIELGGAGFSLQVTERSNTVSVPRDSGDPVIASVQCNSDETVTGGGLGWSGDYPPVSTTSTLKESKKQDNGWIVTYRGSEGGSVLTAYAECLKIVNTGRTD